MANVREPSRLRVIERCITARGVVRDSQVEKDGDVHIYFELDRGFEHLLNDGNRRKHRGMLVVEIVPADQPGCERGEPVSYGTCTGAHIETPDDGTHVSITGPYVYDKNHAWREIHPVWRIRR